ncbi:hypothetical protein GQ42DRAFT_119826, partial [Ramicandelaber brevisporus]
MPVLQVGTLPGESGSSQPVKLMASCDSCRARKNKCDGVKPNCAGCVKRGIPCIYSPLKP